jgi:hypothetical protein
MSGFEDGILGAVLKAVHGEVYHFRDKVFDETPIALALEFDSGVAVTVESAPDGETLALSDRPLATEDMGESGSNEIDDLSDDPLWAAALGQRLTGVVDVMDTALGVTAGVAFRFGDHQVVIVNRGSDLFVVSDIAEDEDLAWGEQAG